MPQEMNRLPEDLAETERLLGGLKPAARVNRDRVMYEAGRAAHRGPAKWLWPSACTILAAACVLLAAFPRTKVVERLIVRTPETPAPLPSSAPRAVARLAPPAIPNRRAPEPATFLGLRDAVLQSGAGVLRHEGGGGATMPALKPGDGLDSLPPWQKRAALATGDRS